MDRPTRPADGSDLPHLAEEAVRSRVVGNASELLAIMSEEPWRLRVTERGEAAVLGPRSDGSGDLAVLGLWCASPRIPALVRDLVEVARTHGFVRLIGPLVPEAQAGPYLRAGLHVTDRVAVLRCDRPADAPVLPPPPGVTIREARFDDLDFVARIDAAAFPAFWRYDAVRLAGLLDADRGAVAEEDGDLIGYTLATVSDGEGGLGRLAVVDGARGRGVGAALASEAVAWLAAHGARAVTLSTQAENEASRRLYGGLGFRRLPDTLVVCASEPLAASH